MDDLKFDKQGGVVPVDSSDMRRAKDADLVTLPRSIDGTNCGNCSLFNWLGVLNGSDVGHCDHHAVNQPVSDRQCCYFWTNSQAIRPWKRKR